MFRLFESFISTQNPSINKQQAPIIYFNMYSKSSLTQGKAGAPAYVTRRVSPGLDRGLEVTIDRNFNKYSKFLVVLKNGSNH